MINLERFCGTDPRAPYMNSPWAEEGATFATNGHVAIMVDGIVAGAGVAAPEILGRLPSLLERIANFNIELRIQLPHREFGSCPFCHGAARIAVQNCPDCGGRGRVDAHREGIDCPRCHGGGEVATPAQADDPAGQTCRDCWGFGMLSEMVDLESAGQTYRYQEKYLRLIGTLPGVKLWAAPDNMQPARFDFRGGRGALMPCVIPRLAEG